MTEGWPPRADVEEFVVEDDVLANARSTAAEQGSRPVEATVGAALRFLAAAVSARAVVEIGTGTGVSGLWLLRGMAADGTLTSIDMDPLSQKAARAAFTAAGNAPSRLRLINGMGLDVLPRLTDGGYDMVFVDVPPVDHARYLEESVRLLRVGGVVSINGVFPDGAVTSPDGLPEVTRLAREDDRLATLLLPVGDGLLAAVKTGR